MKKYKCSICGDKTTWSGSYGYEEFLVCPLCMNKMILKFDGLTNALNLTFKLGEIKKDRLEENLKQ